MWKLYIPIAVLSIIKYSFPGISYIVVTFSLTHKGNFAIVIPRKASSITGYLASQWIIITSKRAVSMVGARSKITWYFRIPSSGHLCPILNRKVLEIVPPLAGWVFNFGSIKSDLNLDANSAKLFFSEPLTHRLLKRGDKNFFTIC